MSRLRRIADRDRIFFVTFNVARGIKPLSEEERDVVLNCLATLRERSRFCLFGCVIMPDHVHLLLAPVSESLVSILRDLKSKSGLALRKQRKSRGAFWQSRYFDFICRRVSDFWEKLDYIHKNPVEAGLVSRAEDWKWSTAAHYVRAGAPGVIPDGVDLPADGRALLWPAPWR